MKRPLLLAVVVTAAAALVLLVVAGRTWGSVTTRGQVGAAQHVAVSGHSVAHALPALAIALLALSVAMLASTGVMRRLAALLAVSVAAAAIPVAVAGHDQVGRRLAERAFGSTARSLGGSRPGWWLLAVVAGAVAVAAAAAVALRGGRWSGLGARYDAPGAAPRSREPERETWDALDRGQDPTIDA